MSDQDLTKKFTDYQNLAKENPNVDVGLLMTAALNTENANLRENKSYRWPYLISLGVPPLGLLFAIKYYINGDEQDKQAALVCVLLTLVSGILMYVFAKVLFSSTGVTPDQIQQIKPSDINQILQ